MSTPLPVPSKVAVTAIRGLIVGTTCSLALLTEDRRRRISNAQNVIQNADRIRSAKNYRSGGAELAIAIEEDAVWFDPARAKIDWADAHLLGTGRTRAREEDSDERTQKELARSVGHAQQRHAEPRSREQLQPQHRDRLDSDEQSLQPSRESHEEQNVHNAKSIRGRIWKKKPRALPPQGLTIALPAGKARTPVEDRDATLILPPTQSLAFPKEDEICKMVQDCAASRDVRQLDQATLLMLQALPSGVEVGQPLLESATLLSRICQELGRFDIAAKVLKAVLQARQLTEDEYYAFQPLDLLEHLLPELESRRNAPGDNAKLVLAVDLYACKLQELPTVRTGQGFNVGKRLLDLSFSGSSSQEKDALYWRCIVHHRDDFAFTQWYITKLHESGDYKRAIKFFELTYAKMSPSQASILETCRVVVESVTAAKGTKARKVLEVLAQLCYPSIRIPSEWVIGIFESHWERFRDMDSIMTMFTSLRDHANEGLGGLVSSPRDIYRAMVLLATKANRPDLKKAIFEQRDQDMVGLESDVAIMGSKALVKAKSGDWLAVEEDFALMKSLNSSPEDMAQAFTPILKIYARSHTNADTDAFLRHFIDHVGVSLCKGTATFMAKEYGAVRDAESLVAWLKYCVESGYAVDASFTNSLLSNCHTNWKLPFKKLRVLQRKIHTLGDGAFTNRNTERIMFEAAIAHSQREPADFRLRKVKVHVSRASALAGTSFSSQEIHMAMKERLLVKRPNQALQMYRKAVAKKLRLPIGVHQLAIKATMQLGIDNIDEAYALANGAAEKEGHSISNLVVPIVDAQLRSLKGRHGTCPEKYDNIKQVLLEDLPSRGITVSESMYNIASRACLDIFHNTGAVNFAMLAAQTHRDAKAAPADNAESSTLKADGIGYNLYNFLVLLCAFARLADADMLRLLLDTARKHTYWTDKRVRIALKHERRDLALKTDSIRVVECEELIAAALDETVVKRRELAEERDEVAAELFAIMEQAATDVGRQKLAAVPAAEQRQVHGRTARTINSFDEIEDMVVKPERTTGNAADATF